MTISWLKSTWMYHRMTETNINSGLKSSWRQEKHKVWAKSRFSFNIWQVFFFVVICSFGMPSTKEETSNKSLDYKVWYYCPCDRKRRHSFTAPSNVRTVGGCKTWWEHPGFSERTSSNRKAASSSCRVCDTGRSVGPKFEQKLSGSTSVLYIQRPTLAGLAWDTSQKE